ncbi:uncharacterized protein PRCAT00006148001 [Priceomyces carsonii]|uniref:uncharacterized protein n=1 Tax=Priceomyces carsonii TaxID=28549 RepID=UPI002ED7CB38|nr:unnamed protein product [Priceomyces carsonii]
MKNSICINLRECDNLMELYKTTFPQKLPVAQFVIDTSLTVKENLNRLALYGLHPTTTPVVAFAYRDIILDIVARWISFPKEFEEQYRRNYTDEEWNNVIPGSIILLALSRLIGCCDECISLTEFYVTKINFFEKLRSLSESKGIISHIELEHILLAFYRLVNHNHLTFSKYVDTRVLYGILEMKESTYGVSKYLAIQILSVYLGASETSRIKMSQNYLSSKDTLVSSYETDKGVDYGTLEVLEAKRLSNFTKLFDNKNTAQVDSKFNMIIEPEDLNPMVICVFGILIPDVIGKSLQQTTADDFIATEKAVTALRKLAKCIQHNSPILLHGKPGSGKTFLINQLAKFMSYKDRIVKIHLGEQTDAKLLLGTYASGEKPGTFEWRAGVLTTAAKEGKWVLVEDIDRAPTEVLSVLLTLLEKRELVIPSRGDTIRAKNGFQIIATIRTSSDSVQHIPDMIGVRLWKLIELEEPDDRDLKNILTTKFPLLSRLIDPFIKCYNSIVKIYSLSSFISLNKGSHPRIISFRDVIKLCSRCNQMLEREGVTIETPLFESYIFQNIFAEAVDCFGSSITEYKALEPVIQAIGASLEIPHSQVKYFMNLHVPQMLNDGDRFIVGRASLQKSISDKLFNKKVTGSNTSFAKTKHSLKLMEQLGVSVLMAEPVLLVGETGTGKTTVVQQLAKTMNKKLTVINVSQQTESGDLLGGYKPVSTRTAALPLQETFETLFIATFSKKRNERFSQSLSKCFNKSQWKNVVKLWKAALEMAKDVLKDNVSNVDDSEGPRKKRKLRSEEKSLLMQKWAEFEKSADDFELHSSLLDNSFVFNFVEGSLVKAVKNGDWLLLDEINLASSDTLESIADLLSDSIDERSILLSERGDIESIKCHPEFRIFGCMNPSTDIGKRDLPSSIRSRFSEIYVHSPDRDIQDLLAIIDRYIHRFALTDEWVGQDIAELYMEAKELANSKSIVDGANQTPHFSIRTLTRTLIYVCDIAQVYGIRRALYEGFCMSFLTLLDLKSEQILRPVIVKYTIGKLKNSKSVMNQCPPAPKSNTEHYVQFRHYWLKQGPIELIPQDHYIITPFVEKNLLNLVRAIAGRRFPVLIQGPTSAGKTSMINYLANITGHKFVRINNHEHTDLQEYLGTYISDSTGKLVFKEGILVRALREGHWIVLDELNLAPTDVLEALNRLLDDNRELFIPETQEVVHPHPDFMLFATQNPPGIYGGRKILSRAFRNRFLELHFDDIPQDELEIILRERCKIAPSYAKKIVEVYHELSVQRQSTRLFEQRNSFATLRDLFRWAFREAIGYEELAANGYMLLAERVRKVNEKGIVKDIIEKVMRVKLDMEAYYEKLEDKSLFNESSIIWTRAMRRLAVLVSTSIKYNEPILLVGETGCGKTTVCQVLAKRLGKDLSVVNAHQNTETSDILGAQRPVRNRYEVQGRLLNNLIKVLSDEGIELPLNEVRLDELIKRYDSLEKISEADQSLRDEIDFDRKRCSALFEWNDGPLTQAMKKGNFFLLDEISLADDSVLERFNSVLEPERSLLLAEKGLDDSFIVANKGFEFFATMNPGGDYGKKELSAALRNRFTEIWVPSMDDFDDVRQIVSSKLDSDSPSLCDSIVSFSEWFGNRFGGGKADSGVISLRDILAWIDFINIMLNHMSAEEAFLQGACMVFVDALGTNNTAFLAENETRLNENKRECISRLSETMGKDLFPFFDQNVEVRLDDVKLTCGAFSIARRASLVSESFNLEAPTTAKNAMRVIRAMQVSKPILLEGSPGVGKTSLISALGKLSGNPLVRINLSEQTDLVDLFGSDAPSEGGKTGEFVWRDAPFLRAMQKGEWVLLDEMNLASQSVLEGLNACLDHRGQAYIPELDRSFYRHPEFKVFAAQNPQYQGGGRKGLPKSFINRFTVVYVDVLKSNDLDLISQHLYPKINDEVRTKIISFISKLESEVVIERNWGSSGGPWEFNLRDTLRWLELLNSSFCQSPVDPSEFLSLIASQRFRTSDDRKKVNDLFESVFGKRNPKDTYFNLGSEFVQAGNAIMKRKVVQHHLSGTNILPLQCNYQILESAIRCVNHKLPLLITGPSNSGKTQLIRYLANVVGAQVDEFAMNNDVDSMDILGGYEQVDLFKAVGGFISKAREQMSYWMLEKLGSVNAADIEPLATVLEVFTFIDSHEINLSNFKEFQDFIESRLYQISEFKGLLESSAFIGKKLQKQSSVRFEWFDGLLVQAVEKGNWLILDNANLCNPSVLDRLNSLLETDGVLTINECSSEDGLPRVIKPHPNFRLFLTADPKYGELSRAMRNRAVEIYIDKTDERATFWDHKLLGLYGNGANSCEKPMTAFIALNNSLVRQFAVFNDSIEQYRYKNVKNMEKLTSALLSISSFVTLRELENWNDVFTSSNEFDDKSKYCFSSISSKLQLMIKLDILSYFVQIYDELSLEKVCTGYDQFQSIHPLINPLAITLILDGSPLKSSEPTYAIENLERIQNTSNKILRLEERAVTGKLNELSYTERSAAVNLGRNIKRPPRFDVYKLIKCASEFVVKFFEQYFHEQPFKRHGIFKSLHDLQILLVCLLKTSNSSSEPKIRVFKDLMTDWAEHQVQGKLTTSYLADLESFGKELLLSTGNSMGIIWETFRSQYPQSQRSWDNCIMLINLAGELDKVVSLQFHEVSNEILDLRNLICQYYNGIISGEVTTQEFNTFFNSLSDGIDRLKRISGSFLCVRQNILKKEFALLCNFMETSMISKFELDSEKLSKLAVLTDRHTMSLTRLKNKKIFAPYPTILDNLWEHLVDNYESSVSGLFSTELISSTIQKLHLIPSGPGKYLQQNIDDLDLLAKYLISDSKAVLNDQKVIFTNLLVNWFLELLSAHRSTFPDSFQEEISNLSTIRVEDLKVSPEHLLKLIQSSENDQFIKVCEEFMIPALHLALKGNSIRALGKAWVIFSCGAIQLFVPSSAFDPAIKEHVVYEVFSKQQESSRELVEAWKSVRVVDRGDNNILLENFLPSLNDSEKPLKPRVFRGDAPVEPLFEEWNAFMESSVDVRPIRSLLDSAENLNQSSFKIVETFQRNSMQFLHRLSANYILFSDLNDILKGYVLGLKLGLELVTMTDPDLGRGTFTALAPTDAVAMTSESFISEGFDEVRELVKLLDLDSTVPELVMIYYIQLYFGHTSESRVKLDSVLKQAFQLLYYRWTLRKLKADEALTQSNLLYKYTEKSAEEDFRSLFPDYEDVMGISIESKSKDSNFEDVYQRIARIYIDAFLFDKATKIESLVQEGSDLSVLIAPYVGKGPSETIKSSYFAALIMKFGSTKEEFSTNATKLNFYYDNSTVESKNAISIVSSLYERTCALLDEWPEHSTLQNIAKSADEYLMLPANTPIARLLQKIEQIYTFIAEWEKYASKSVSLKSYFDRLTHLIVSWRKLELSTWRALFEYEDAAVEKDIGKWWFHLFETIIIPELSETEEYEKDTIKLISALNLFMSDAKFGEFEHRLNLLKAFGNHVFMISSNNTTSDSLANVVTFYSQFLPLVKENIVKVKKGLEKDVSEVILLASWKDVNIDALKQSSRRSHNNLYKIVRKYRSLLASPVGPLIEQGISPDVKCSDSLTPLPSLPRINLDERISDICQRIDTWSSRPKRLQNITIVEKNMENYINQLVAEKNPDLYGFAKDLLFDMERLRDETPKELTKENKRQVSALKTQKLKLISNTLKELRRMGLKTNINPKIHKVQTTVNLILSNSKSFDGTSLKGCDLYYFRLLDLLPRLRASVNKVAEDAPQGDAEKGLAAVENVLFSLITTRGKLFELSNGVEKLLMLFNTFLEVSDLSNSLAKLNACSKIESAKINMKHIESAIFWLPQLFDYTLRIFDSLSNFGISANLESFDSMRRKLNELDLKGKKLFFKPYSQEAVEYIKEFRFYVDEVTSTLTEWREQNQSLAFVANIILGWLTNAVRNDSPESIAMKQECDFEAVKSAEKSLRQISNLTILAVQRVTEIRSESISEEDDNWLVSSQQRLFSMIKICNYRQITGLLEKFFEIIFNIEHDNETSELTTAMAAFTLPLLQHYLKLVRVIFERARENYAKTSRATYILSNVLYTLASKGLCSPEKPSESKEDNNLQEGEGLGDGEGATNKSNDMDEDISDDDLEHNNENQDDSKDDDEKEAADASGQVNGDLEDASDQEENDEDKENDEDEELDEEVDDIDDLDPNAIDEKMWDEEAQDDSKEKETDQKMDQMNKDEEMEANEDTEQNSDQANKEEQKDENAIEKDDVPDQEEEDKDADEQDVGEQDDEVRAEENEQLEENVEQSEALNLPEDMNLDEDDDGEDDADGSEDGKDDLNDELDAEEVIEEEEESLDNKEQDNFEDKVENDLEGGDSPDESNEEEIDHDDLKDEAPSDAENEKGDEASNDEDISVDGDDINENEKTEDNPENGNEESLEGAEGGLEEAANDDIDMESAVKQESGSRSEGADSEVADEKDDIGASGSASTEVQQDESNSESKNDARDLAKESLKQLGDSLKEFHKRHQEIKEARIEDEETIDESANTRPDEFQHVEGENSNFDTQAMGAADKEQTQALDDDKAIEDDLEEAPDMKDAPEDKEDDMDVDEMNESKDNDLDADLDKNPQMESSEKAAGEVKNEVEEASETLKNEFEDELEDEFLDNEIGLDSLKVNETSDVPPLDIETAREIWKESEMATQELASGLCEQLRLILEPTVATKLRGDFKTGKRLNMKRIIPYIASDFRKDKIWLRRTKPSKRQYQVMIAVDDSKSMSESKSTELAFHSIALVAKALTQLESGGLSIVRFGEDVKLIHPFDKPFNNQETGARVFQWFDFQQARTDVKELCAKSLRIFEDARATTNSDLWQLQIIISDGVCENHETIQRLVRKAREEKIMLVFVVIDGINSNESIMDMSQVSYITDEDTGSMKLKVDKYLDSFPFEFYVIVKNINELPEMLSLILRQYFSEMASA